MKVTWYGRPDGSWHARYYPKGEGPHPEPYHLSVEEQESMYPWRWTIQRYTDLVKFGESSDLEAARMAAHEKLAKMIMPSPTPIKNLMDSLE